jgi:hypothetical protein
MKELWKIIIGFERLYEISNKGNVRNSSGKTLKQNLVGRPRVYLDVSLYKNGKRKHMRINRLVAFAFIPNNDPIGKPEVNHRDGDTINNFDWNLEWVSRCENEWYKHFMRGC